MDLFRPWTVALLCLLLAGCCSEGNPDNSQLPWARPVGWEGSNSFTAALAR
ncbi:MAG: hypothetical protein LBT98_04185 [Puniceicoccales bacterium]|jgi:hypothetical protein|nr:hypothetical protein [Puniceicoccales bacterium]